METRLWLLHLSDVHFNKHSDGTRFDLDKDLRDEVERDVGVLVQQLGSATGIIVTGDIAYSGARTEYEKAATWLDALCAIAKCPTDMVWTVPGNHDVDRKRIRECGILRDAHKAFRTCTLEELDDRLRGYMQEPASCNLLLEPLTEYNLFAMRFECDVSRERPFWQSDLKLNDGSTLRLSGLNSTLVSDDDDSDGDGRLILGAAQTNLPRLEGVIHMTLCHHPPNWLRDVDTVESDLRARVRLQLFGHKHVQTRSEIDGNLRIVAGAVHPNRREPKWIPRFNALAISVNGSGNNRRLDVRVYSRIWSDSKEFVAERDPRTGRDFFQYFLSLPAWSPSTPAPAAAQALPAQPGPTASPAVGRQEAPMNPHRTLVHRFLSLPFHKRMTIAAKLELIDDSDQGVNDPELSRRLFARAKERRVVAALWDAVEAQYPDGAKSNPFSQSQQ
ncbi:MAG: metallophosphoesterase [Myxococcota bacterium]